MSGVSMGRVVWVWGRGRGCLVATSGGYTCLSRHFSSYIVLSLGSTESDHIISEPCCKEVTYIRHIVE